MTAHAAQRNVTQPGEPAAKEGGKERCMERRVCVCEREGAREGGRERESVKEGQLARRTAGYAFCAQRHKIYKRIEWSYGYCMACMRMHTCLSRRVASRLPGAGSAQLARLLHGYAQGEVVHFHLLLPFFLGSLQVPELHAV